MTVYAATTSVSVEKSKAEIETLLTRYGASHFMSGWSPEGSVIAFEVQGRRVRFMLPLPRKDRTREQARWFGRRLYRKIRVTFEDAGEVSPEELAAFADEEGHLHKHQDNLEFAKGMETKKRARQLSLTSDDEEPAS